MLQYTPDRPPLQCFMRQSNWYRHAKPVPPLGVLWHSTGADNPNLARYVQPDDDAPNRAQLLSILGTNPYHNDWNHQPNLDAGVHAFIGRLADGTVSAVQVGPWNLEAWGVGTGTTGYSLNQGWIQFECCEDDLRDRQYFEAVYQQGVQLTAYLCTLFSFDPLGTVDYHGIQVPVITSHRQSYELGLGSNHGDPLLWFDKFGKTMEDVRRDVAALLQEPEPEPKPEPTPTPEPTPEPRRFNTLEEIQTGFPWAYETVSHLVQIGALSGTGQGLDLSVDMLRVLTIVDRAGGLPRSG